jgi:hypothetical protein
VAFLGPHSEEMNFSQSTSLRHARVFLGSTLGTSSADDESEVERCADLDSGGLPQQRHSHSGFRRLINIAGPVVELAVLAYLAVNADITR